MRVIALDTSTDDTVVAAAEDGIPVYERVVPPRDRRPLHSQVLLELVDEAARSVGGWEGLDRIAVGVGPGTFTGIRIGVATAAGLSASTGVQAVGVPTLTALAISVAEAAGSDGPTMPLIDARRGEVFGCLHDGSHRPAEEPFVCGPDALVERLQATKGEGPPPLIGGPGAVRFRDELIHAGFDVEPPESPAHRLTGRPFCDLGAAAEVTGPETLEPLYLRIPDAQLWLERDGKAGPDRGAARNP